MGSFARFTSGFRRLCVGACAVCLGASLLASGLLAIGSVAGAQTIQELETAFADPPAEARPWVFWYWMRGRVSAEGITADLKAMRTAGIGGAYLMPIQGPTDPPEYEPIADQLSPRFWQMIRHAAAEADRLGLKLGMHVCDGFATAGGPWITPELSMQQLVWSETSVQGGSRVNLLLQQPETKEDFYQDIAILAFPRPPGFGVDTMTVQPKVTTSDEDPEAGRLIDPENKQRYRSKDSCWIEYAFDEPFTARSVTVAPDGSNYQCQRMVVESSDDGVDWQVVSQLDAPRHGWQEEGLPVTHALPETTARRFRFSWDPNGSEPGAEDLDAAKWAPVLKVQSIVLSATPRVHHYRGKSGTIWRISPPTTEQQAPPSLCTSADSILDLTSLMKPDGSLAWDAPAGEWVVMRFGHTSTGRRNATAGGGIGLECDKMKSDAVRLQFNNWFGEAQRQIAEALEGKPSSRVLTTLHVDSWECGAQNWTSDLPDQYRERCGRDLRQWLPAMAGVPIESAEQSEQVLRDVRETLAELVSERFYGTLRTIADREGLRFTGECTAPTMPGDGMRHFASLDAPMGEFWLDSPTHDKPTDMRDAISGAHVAGKRMIQAEAFTQLRIGWDETPASIKRLGDRNLALGANRLVIHVWTHNPWLDRKPGQTLGGVGLYFQRDQPWVPYAQGWTDYLARCQAVLQAGEPVVDIAVATSDDYPRRALTPDKLVDRLPGLMGKAFVDGERGRLFNEGQPQREMPVGVRASANLPDPSKWTDPLRGYQYDTVPPHHDSAASKGGYALIYDTEDAPWTEADLSSLGVPRDFEAFETNDLPAKQIAWTHRRGPGWDAYFVSNQAARHRDLRLSLRAKGRAVELWDPNSGDRRRMASTFGTRTEVPLPLAPQQAVLLIVRGESNLPAEGPMVERPAVTGKWRLSFNPAVGPKPQDRTLGALTDLTPDESLRGFAGEVRYQTTLQLDQAIQSGDRAWLDVGGASALAVVWVNGIECGVAWTAPWRVEVTDALMAGQNELEIITASTWKNALIADQERPEDERLTWTSAPVRLANESLVPLGVTGPVRLLIERPATGEDP